MPEKWQLYTIAFIFGAIVGSFLNVCIYRLPINQSIVFPGSRCMSCHSPVRWYDNIPVISWLILRGRCRNCGVSFSARYPFVELITAMVSAALFWKYGLSIQLPVMFLFCAALVVITFIDFDHQIIPDEISLPGIAIGFILSFFMPGITWISSAMGIVVGWGSLAAVFYGYLWLTGREGMGGGDLKLLAMMGAFLGLKSIPFIIFASSLVGTVVGVSIIVIQKKGRHLAIPFGPYLAFGGVLYIFFGSRLIDWYFRLGR